MLDNADNRIGVVYKQKYLYITPIFLQCQNPRQKLSRDAVRAFLPETKNNAIIKNRKS